MQLKFCGGAHTVTGSQHLLSANGNKILLECGLFQGRRAEAYEKNQQFAYDPASLDAVLLSHAHIDHSGNLPSLVARGYGGPIYATAATMALCQLMLRDSAYLQERDIEWVNKIRRRRGEPLAEPLYSIEDAEAALGPSLANTNVTDQIEREISPGTTEPVMTLAYDRMAVILWQACRSMLARVEVLEARVAQLSAPQ